MNLRENNVNILNSALTFFTILSGITYFIWVMFNLNYEFWFIATIFLAAEFGCLILMIVSTINNKKCNFRPTLKNGLEQLNKEVDILITTCGEPLNLVKNTILAAINIDYKYKTIYVLDDAGNKELKKICNDLSIIYTSRNEKNDRKAGNLNHGLKLTSGEFILTLDADQISSPEILEKIMPYFENENVGFVPTCQSFIVPKNDPFGNSDTFFYKVMQVSKSHDNAAISCGSGVVYRRKALESVHGFSTWSVIEDLYTSMLLHANGWKSIYIVESYTRGTAPTNIITQTRQRYQWALDSLRIFFWDNPLFKKGLNFHQKLQYFSFGYHYIAFGFFIPLMFFFPIWTLFTGKSIFNASWLTYTIYRLQYTFFISILNKFVTFGYSSLKAFQMQVGLFPFFFIATLVSLVSKDQSPQYFVTEKKEGNYSLFTRIKYVILHLILIFLNILALGYNYFYYTSGFWFRLVITIWAIWVVISLSRMTILAIFPDILFKSKDNKSISI